MNGGGTLLIPDKEGRLVRVTVKMSVNYVYMVSYKVNLDSSFPASRLPSKEFSADHGGLVAKSCLTFATPWTVAHPAPRSMGFSRQEYWSGLQFPFLESADHRHFKINLSCI